MEITKLDFKLHSIIILVGPDNSGQTNFIFKLSQELKKFSSAKKKVTIAQVNMREIYSELTGQDSPNLHSIDCVQVKEQAVEIAMSKIKSFTSYPVNIDFVIINSSGLNSEFRNEIVGIANENHYNVSAVVFNYKNQEEYFTTNNGVRIGPHPGQMKELRRAISGEMSKDKFESVHIICTINFDTYEINIVDFEEYEKHILPEGPEYVIIGDVHGCFDELLSLLEKNGFIIDEQKKVSHPENKIAVFVGDLIDKGYGIKEVIEFVYLNLDVFFLVVGNHENLVYKSVSGVIKKNDMPVKENMDEFFSSYFLLQEDEELKFKFIAIFEKMKNFYIHKDFVITHAPCEKKYLGKIDSVSLRKTRDFRYPKRRDYNMLFDFIIDFDERCEFVSSEANDYHPVHIFGHVMSKTASKFKNKIDIDTGCVAGGELTSVVVGKYRKIVTESVPAGDKLKGKGHELHNFFI